MNYWLFPVFGRIWRQLAHCVFSQWWTEIRKNRGTQACIFAPVSTQATPLCFKVPPKPFTAYRICKWQPKRVERDAVIEIFHWGAKDWERAHRYLSIRLKSTCDEWRGDRTPCRACSVQSGLIIVKIIASVENLRLRYVFWVCKSAGKFNR